MKLLDILGNIIMGVDWRDQTLIWNQSAYVQFNDGFTEACQINKGVRQGYSLSPLLYIIYDEAMMKEATENVQEGTSVGGATVSLMICR